MIQINIHEVERLKNHFACLTVKLNKADHFSWIGEKYRNACGTKPAKGI